MWALFAALALASCPGGSSPADRSPPTPSGTARTSGDRPGPLPPQSPPVRPAAPAAPATPLASETPAADGGSGTPPIRLAWEIGPLRRLGQGIYRNDVELVVGVDPPVRIRVTDLQYCWEMVENVAADPVPGAVAVLSCYNAGYGDYVVVARERGRGERYVVKAYGRAEGGEDERAPKVERLRTVGRFVTPAGATFASDISWPHGEGDQVRDDDS